MKFSAIQVAAVIQGLIEGDEKAEVTTLAKIEEASEGALCFLANTKYEDYLYTTKASIVIINDSLELKKPVSTTLIRVPDAYLAFSTLLTTYEQITKVTKTGISEYSAISASAKIGSNVYIGPYAVIDDHVVIGDNVQIYPHTYVGSHCKVGDNSIIYANVSIYDRCEMGKNCVIHAGAVIGSDGFGFAPKGDGTYNKIPQLGNVVLGDHVEIGANSAIDRATMGSTLVCSGTKIDNLVQLAHNVVIGENTVIAAQAGISGSTKLGKNNLIGGQAGLIGHLQLADGTKVNAQSGVTKSIREPNTAVNGSPAFDYNATIRSQVIFRKLPDLANKLAELEQKLEELKKGT